MNTGGLHHVTAVTGNAPGNLAFYRDVLGLRLVKKTVNQDDWSAYHLFYADEHGSPGSEITFFDWPRAGRRHLGAGSVTRTGLYLDGGSGALEAWRRWLAGANLPALRQIESQPDGTLAFDFSDPEGQSLQLISGAEAGTQAAASGTKRPPIEALGAVTVSVAELEPTVRLLTDVLGLQLAAEAEGLVVCAVAAAASGGRPPQTVRVQLATRREAAGQSGVGGVHHVAFRAADAAEHLQWRERLRTARVAVSEVIDRFYFKSIYFREPGGVLFEIATDGPGFAVDEAAATMGEQLSLPPALEPHRAQIERGLQPLPSIPARP